MAALLASAPPAGCRPEPAPPATLFLAREVGLTLPQLPGWSAQSDGLAPAPRTQGGLVLRLSRDAQLAGSPRVEVVWEPPPASPTVLEEFLARNLRQMAQLEHAGAIHIDHVEQRRLHVGHLPAYRVRHEYSVGSGAGQVALHQISTFVVVDGRGVAITAAGRVELFHPLADQIGRMLEGLRFGGGRAGAGGVGEGGTPVDLGQIGGAGGAPTAPPRPRGGGGRPRP